jgi:hypothetical protein
MAYVEDVVVLNLVYNIYAYSRRSTASDTAVYILLEYTCRSSAVLVDHNNLI